MFTLLFQPLIFVFLRKTTECTGSDMEFSNDFCHSMNGDIRKNWDLEGRELLNDAPPTRIGLGRLRKRQRSQLR
jgi:hypothetical protein